jgi:hypothetical protein
VANIQRGEAELIIDGKPYTLVVDLNACCEFEAMISTPANPVLFAAGFQRVIDGRITETRAFIWAALRRHHKLSLDDVNELIQQAGGVFGGGVRLFTDAIRELIMPSLRPDPEDEVAIQDGPTSRPIAAVPPMGTAGTGRSSTGKRVKSA